MKSILIAPYWQGELNNQLFKNEQSVWSLLKRLLYQNGYEINTIDMGSIESAECILFHDNLATGSLNYEYLQQCIRLGKKTQFLLLECPVVEPHLWDRALHENFSRIITWNDDLIDHQKYFKIFYPSSSSSVNEFFIPFADRKLITMVVGNKVSSHPLELYSKRREAIRAFEKICPEQFDLWGRGWNQPATELEVNQPVYYPSYRGEIDNKFTVLGRYKFCICYENMTGSPGYSGYITEKVIDCFLARCIPVYLGANNIRDYIPVNTFIDPSSFSSYYELYNYLMDITEIEYMGYINRINEFITSKFYDQHFSQHAFASTLLTNLIY